MRFIDSNDKLASIAMILMGLSFVILYPKNLWVGLDGWIWDYPSRHIAFEHMFLAVYVTLGVFLVWGARDPIRALPLINFTIVSGVVHASVMAVDAFSLPGMHNHLGLRGDVVGTYLAPVVLTLCHPHRFFWRARVKTAAT